MLHRKDYTLPTSLFCNTCRANRSWTLILEGSGRQRMHARCQKKASGCLPLNAAPSAMALYMYTYAFSLIRASVNPQNNPMSSSKPSYRNSNTRPPHPPRGVDMEATIPTPISLRIVVWLLSDYFCHHRSQNHRRREANGTCCFMSSIRNCKGSRLFPCITCINADIR